MNLIQWIKDWVQERDFRAKDKEILHRRFISTAAKSYFLRSVKSIFVR